LHALAANVAESAAAWQHLPLVAAVLRDLERAVVSLPTNVEEATLDEALADLEFTTLDALLGALPAEMRNVTVSEVEAEMADLQLADEVRERTRHALVVKALRRLIGLPRLEVATGAP
jgi:hypothetical protein